jgi:hypothetical protein
MQEEKTRQNIANPNPNPKAGQGRVKTRQDKTEGDKTRHDKENKTKRRQDKTRQDKVKARQSEGQGQDKDLMSKFRTKEKVDITIMTTAKPYG